METTLDLAPLPGNDVLFRMRRYLRARLARLRACPGGDVSKFPGRYVWYCEGCGEEFESEEQACASQHGEQETQ